MKKSEWLIFALALLLVGGGAFWWANRTPSSSTPIPAPVRSAVPASPAAAAKPAGSSPRRPKNEDLARLRREMEAQLNQPLSSSGAIPLPAEETSSDTVTVAPPPVPVPSPTGSDARAQGRRDRSRLPLGVILWDRVPAYEASSGERSLYQLQTGDLVRVSSEPVNGRRKIHPGLDVYLAATTRQTETTGNRLPDVDAWVPVEDLQVFGPSRAEEFLGQTDPMTLGLDPDFSTLSFYERAMKNPDSVVHRVIGARLIAVAALHEDYVSSWPALIRDRDAKIRAAALAKVRERGVAQSSTAVDDLIQRLAELTGGRAHGEQEEEVILILSVLKESGQARVPLALASFVDAWRASQSGRVNDALKDAIQGSGGTSQ